MMIFSPSPSFWMKKVSFDDFFMTTWEQEKKSKRKKEPQYPHLNLQFGLNLKKLKKSLPSTFSKRSGRWFFVQFFWRWVQTENRLWDLRFKNSMSTRSDNTMGPPLTWFPQMGFLLTRFPKKFRLPISCNMFLFKFQIPNYRLP